MEKKVIAIVAVVILLIAGAGIAVMTLGDNESAERDLDVNLEIYGNADKNWRVDGKDAELVQKWIDAKEKEDSETIESLRNQINLDFADANNDGRIDSKDVEQINAIAKGTAKKLWFLDGTGAKRGMDISNINRIGCEYFSNTEAMLILGQNDKIVAVDNAPYIHRSVYFSEEQQKNLVNLQSMNNPDYDFVNAQHLDVLLTFSDGNYEAKQDKLPGTEVIYLGLYLPDLTNTKNSSFIQGILKAGYIFGAVDRATGYADWILEYRDKLLDISNSIPVEKKPVVLVTNYMNQYLDDETSTIMTAYTHEDPLGQAIEMAGGNSMLDYLNIDGKGYGFKVSIDVVFNNHPVDYIFCHNVKYTFGGTTTTAPQHGYLIDDYSEFEAACKDAMSKPLVKDEVITMLAGDFRNGCTGGVLLAAYMGNLINPEYYSGIDPIKMHEEYIDWMGLDYDITKHGVFFYTGTA